MPTTDKYGQGIQHPVLSDVPNMETAMSTLVNGLVPQTVMRFANANERSANLAGTYKPVPGMITYLIAEDRWEAYQANGGWLLLSDGPWQPLTFVTGYTANGGSPAWRRKAGGGIELRGRIQRSNGAALINDGTIVPFARLPQAVTPAATRYFITATNRTTTGDDTHLTARIEVSSSGEIRYTIGQRGGGTGSGTPWFVIDGIQFSPAGD